MRRSKGKRDDFLTSMGWFLPLFCFGLLLLLTGSKAEVKELMGPPQAESEPVRTSTPADAPPAREEISAPGDGAAQAVPVKALYIVPGREEARCLQAGEAMGRQEADGPAKPASTGSDPPDVPAQHP